MTGSNYQSDYDIETINELGLNPIQPTPAEGESIFSTVDDETMIQRFARGKKRSVRNNNLSIEYTHNSLQLATPQGELIAINKVSNKLHYILLKQDSRYWEFIHNIVLDYNFVPIDNNPTQRGFFRYQKYQIPAGYQLRYSSGFELQSFWQEHNDDTSEMHLDLLFLNKSKWHRVQDVTFQDRRLLFRSVVGVIDLPADTKMAWIYQLSPVVDESFRRKTLPPNAVIPPSDILEKITSKLRIEEEIPSDVTMTLDDDVLVNLDDDALALFERVFNSNSRIEIPETLRQQVLELQISALKIMENYVQHGENITRTEIVTDNNGKKISEKTIVINRGCPRWVLDSLLKVSINRQPH
jgi:hypothetical protein